MIQETCDRCKKPVKQEDLVALDFSFGKNYKMTDIEDFSIWNFCFRCSRFIESLIETETRRLIL